MKFTADWNVLTMTVRGFRDSKNTTGEGEGRLVTSDRSIPNEISTGPVVQIFLYGGLVKQ